MPRGQPDFGMYATKEVAASMSDLGEVAARLGSIVTYDRRGDVVFFDDFEEPVFKWDTDVIPATSSVMLDSVNPKSGSQAVKLYTTANTGAYALIQKYTCIQVGKQIGLELSFSRLSEPLDLFLRLYYYNGEDYYRMEVKIDPEAKEIYVLKDPPIYTKVANIGIPRDTVYLFHVVKVVADLNTGMYKRLLYDNLEFDISDEVVFSDLSSERFHVWLTAYQQTRVDTGGTSYLDDIILTQNEP